MATYNFSLTPKSRGKGKSAAAELSYISRTKLNDIRTGNSYDNRERKDLVYSKVFLPKEASPDWKDLQKLANAVEEYSYNPNARIGKSFICAIPNELSEFSHLDMVEEFCNHLKEQGIVAAIGAHDEVKKQQRNKHIHIFIPAKPCKNGKFVPGSMVGYKCIHNGEYKVLTANEFNELRDSGNPAEKIYKYVLINEEATDNNILKLTPSEYEAHYKETYIRKSKQPEKVKIDLTEWDSTEWLKKERKYWADLCNKYLALEGIEERVSEKSYKEQGIEKIPEIHLGPVVAEMERKNPGSTEKGKKNMSIQQRNKEIDYINKLLDNNIITNPDERKMANKIKRELLWNDSAMLIEYRVKSVKLFNEIIKKLKETTTLFCSFITSCEGLIVLLYHQYLKVKEMIDSIKERTQNNDDSNISELIDNATRRSKETIKGQNNKQDYIKE